MQYKILILEDNAADAELIVRELKKSGMEFISEVATNEAEFMDAIDGCSPDLILADYKLPGFSGLDALKIAKEKCPEVPVIMVTGVLGDEKAVEVIKQGASDYLLKENLFKLAQKSMRAIEEAENKKRLAQFEKEKKETLARVFRQSQLASLGELSAGLAHEIRNPLQIILGNADMLIADGNETEELRDIKKAAAHCKKILDNLLDFGRQQEMIKEPESINDILDGTIALYGRRLEHSRLKVVKIYGDLPKIAVAGSRIKQVFFNIISNSQTAMPSGGTLTITTRKTADNFVEISFKDTGAGISKENQEHLFEPFFTTRRDGTGLGLSISYGIIKKHGGEIRVFSEGEGKGSEFIIRMPIP